MNPHLEELLRDVSRIRKELSGGLGRREPDFLALGSALADYSAASFKLSEKAGDLAGLTSAGQLKQAVERIGGLLFDLTGFCSLDECVSSRDELDKVLGIIRRIGSIMADFGRIVKKLSMLGMSTRVESARLGDKGRGFSTLADDVEKLAAKIVEHCQQISFKTAELEPLILQAAEKTQEILSVQRQCSESLFERAKANMQALVGLDSQSGELSLNIEKTAKLTAANISSAVSSLQFHDIVRQQVEHIDEGLGDILHEAEILRQDLNDEDLARESLDWLSFTTDMAKLQASLARNAAQRLGQAVNELGASLSGIADGVSALGEQIGQLREGGGSALEELDSGVNQVVTSFRNYSVHSEALGQIMVSVAETVSHMSEYVSEIEDVGAAIELIAINSSIKAAQTGEEGKALGVLAAAIQRLSVEAITLTDAINEILRGISESSEVLRENSKSYFDAGQVGESFTVLNESLGQVREIEAKVEGHFAGLRQDSRALGQEITQTARQTLTLQELSAQIETAGEAILKLAERAEAMSGPGGGKRSVRPQRLADLLGRYTMKEERLIHNRLMGLGQGQAQAEEEDESGGVELF